MSGERWSRAVAWPRVWRRCVGRVAVDGRLPRFVIQDAPDDMHEEIVAFMSTFFPRDEPICEHLQLWRDPVSMSELQQVWRDSLKQHATIVALLEEDGEVTRRIVGCNVLGVISKADSLKPNPHKGEPMRKFVDALFFMNKIACPYERFAVEDGVVGLGLSIDPAFRGQGLGLEIVRARFDMGRTVGLRMTYTVFTAIQSQMLGSKVGMDTLVETPYDQYKPDGEFVLAGLSFPKSMKLMAQSID